MSKAARTKHRQERQGKAGAVAVGRRDQTSTNKFLGAQLDMRSAGEKIRDRVAEQRDKDDRVSRALRDIAPVEGEELGDGEKKMLARALARSGVMVAATNTPVVAERTPEEIERAKKDEKNRRVREARAAAKKSRAEIESDQA